MPDFYTEFGQSNFGVSSMRKGAEDGLVYFMGANYKIYWITRGDGIYKEHLTGDDYIRSILPHPENANLVLRLLVICDESVEPLSCTTQVCEIFII